MNCLDALGSRCQYLDHQKRGTAVLELAMTNGSAVKCAVTLYRMAILKHKWAKALVQFWGNDHVALWQDLCFEFSAMFVQRVLWFYHTWPWRLLLAHILPRALRQQLFKEFLDEHKCCLEEFFACPLQQWLSGI